MKDDGEVGWKGDVGWKGEGWKGEVGWIKRYVERKDMESKGVYGWNGWDEWIGMKNQREIKGPKDE